MDSHIFFVDRRDGKAIINSHTQSGGTGVRTSVMKSGLSISTFLPIELGLMRHLWIHISQLNKYKKNYY
jgi:hypothetical protein